MNDEDEYDVIWLSGLYKDLEVEVGLFQYDNPSIRIVDSYRINKKEDIEHILKSIHESKYYEDFCKHTGYSRTFKSQYREWKAHNLLYKFGIFPMRTGSVDLDEGKSKFRRFVYAILSIF